jgi:pimeloyl-ACP methyl ester carboxylesterase
MSSVIERQVSTFAVHPEDLPGEWSVAGWHSAPAAAAGTPLLVLVHGAYMTHDYWDSAFRPEVYSTVQWCLDNGLATLAIDRLGHGASGRPPGDALTAPVHAQTYRDVVARIRADGLDGRHYDRVVLVGHSFGSLSAGLMQASYGGADALVYTGITGPNVVGINDTPEANAAFLRLAQPVANDPNFADRLGEYDDGYYSWSADRRQKTFFRIPPAEDGVVAEDARVVGTMTAGENRTLGRAADAAGSVTDCPVLVQLGQYDRLFYNARVDPDTSSIFQKAVAAASPNFTFAPLVPDAGHNLTQHPNAPATYAQMAAWVNGLFAS